MKKAFCMIAALLLLLTCGCQKAPVAEQTTTTQSGAVTIGTIASEEESTTAPETSATTATSSADTSSVTMVPESYGEWFLREPDIAFTNMLPKSKVSEPYQEYLLTTPGKAVFEQRNVTTTVDLFKTQYRFGEALQVRVTVKNNGDQTFHYVFSPDGCTVEGKDGKVAGDNMFLAEHLSRFEQNVKMRRLAPGESFVAEYMFVIRDEFADATHLRVSLVWGYDGNTVNPAWEESFGVSVPLEVIPG